jgi:acetyl-CoA carboxylase biotin carboxylase subunit
VVGVGIRRLLVANRGEIAVRIIRACREMGVESVAVHTDAEARAMHASMADRAVSIGAAAAEDSYLSIAKLVAAAQSTGADAIHPGYGFLSENAAFAAACEQAGLTFVGPTSQVIALLGSKIDARRLMQQAGVPIVPGEMPGEQTDEALRAAVERVGLPAFVKASAGGGGKGMRLVRDRSGIAAAVQEARREAVAAFGNGTLYVERVVERPRHVEVQIFGDHHGRVVHLFERECSVQRRHQKVIEESPSPAISPALGARITDAALRAARAVSYRNAGTIEFLVDLSRDPGDEGAFSFLEMNTRLQVEHPVTELVAGVDLVRAQLLVASGEALPWSQEMLRQRGHAMEARIYAEDPSKGFLPQAGRLLLYREPRLPGVRVDGGVAEGDEVSVHYDPLLAKVIAWAETRGLAVARLIAALRSYPVLGIRTNIPYLLRILEHPDFRAGMVDTGFLDRESASLLEEDGGKTPEFVVAAVAAHARESRATTTTWQARSSWDPWDAQAPTGSSSMKL